MPPGQGVCPAVGDSVRLLTSQVLRQAVSIAEVVEMVERGYRERATGALLEVPRIQLRADGVRTFFNVTQALAPAMGWACVFSYTGGNRGRSVPQKVALVFSTEDGGLRAIIECDWLSWARTGATGAVATRYLANPGPVTLGIFGSGRQARAQVSAISATRELRGVVVYSRDLSRRSEFAREVSQDLGIDAIAADRPEAVLESAEVISTATNSTTPVFDGAALREGTHVNAIGQHYPDRRELDDPAILRSAVFVDNMQRALQEEGELLIPIARGVTSEQHIAGTLGEVMIGRHPGRTAPDQTTVFLSGGTAEEYLAVASGVLELAIEKGLGETIPMTTDHAFRG